MAMLLIAVIIDFAFGDPPSKIHPVAWMGRITHLLLQKAKRNNVSVEKFLGGVIAVSLVSASALLAHFLLFYVQATFGLIPSVIVGAIMLKLTFTVKTMENFVRPISTALGRGDIPEARKRVSNIVGRRVEELDESHVISATVESIGEGTLDGATGALFYFALLGVPGAVAYRTISTLDSMLGYKSPYYINIGYFSAKLDTILNYIPGRLTALLMVAASFFSRENWRGSLRILRRDRNKTDSPNAGWTMSAIAGALGLRLEKIGFYSIGDDREQPSLKHHGRAIRIMKVSVVLFLALIVVPLIFLV